MTILEDIRRPCPGIPSYLNGASARLQLNVEHEGSYSRPLDFEAG
jgi:hypothetical protein